MAALAACVGNTLSRAERRWKYGVNIQLGQLAVLIPPTGTYA